MFKTKIKKLAENDEEEIGQVKDLWSKQSNLHRYTDSVHIFIFFLKFQLCCKQYNSS